MLELSVRLTKILKKNDIHTLEDLITKDTFELEGTGPVFRKELEEVINEIKLEVNK
ncbi:DNA-directed RNA polymerase subunit alpha C-terminal domain-containing protein [Sporosarcina psychrophila]|uniref:DNA-directed RNA polymerase subunit alpha C-terminal domain-containing protein n=1 Tax=Sporosarcina psychrophila TaxID=1476 RepID=UPI0009ED0CED